MKLIASIAAAVALFASPAFAAAPAAPISLPAKTGNVAFNHKTHTMDCTKCHADAKGGKIELNKDKAHALCVDCHKTGAKGPTKCAECHKK